MRNLAEAIPAGQYLPAEGIPEIAFVRQQVRKDAWDTVELRRQQLASGQEADVPLALDALSTAERVLDLGAIYSENSREYREGVKGLDMDCLRLVTEWYRKNGPEYFPALRHTFDAATEDFFSHGWSIRQMTENALRPIVGDPEEVDRRVNEKVEHETTHVVRRLGSSALSGVGIRTISECTDKAIQDYRHDMETGAQHRGYNGYVPEIEKVMIRDMRIDPVTGDRIQEQVGVPGTYITHEVIQIALLRRGVDTTAMNKTELHGTQLLVEDDVMDFVMLLDEVASEQWGGANIFMGELVPDEHNKSYEQFRAEAFERQEKLKNMAEKTATHIMDLAADRFDKRKAPAHVEQFVKIMLLDMAKKNPEVATQIFDEKTANGLQKVAALEDAGRFDEAYRLQQQIEKIAPGGGYCSGGSCGLESVNVNSAEGQDLMGRLKAKSGDTIVKDKERKCKCGGSVVYAYNARKVNKLCEGCGAFESKQSSVTSQQQTQE